MSLFRCPVCGAPLSREERVYRCPARAQLRHRPEGYTYLLPQSKTLRRPRRRREMAAARRDFLSKGYYNPLLNTLCSIILAHTSPEPVILDAGCGEGYYTAGIHHALLEAGRRPQMAGTDISKFILRTAAKRDRDIAFAVASSYIPPVADDTWTYCWTAFPLWP